VRQALPYARNPNDGACLNVTLLVAHGLEEPLPEVARLVQAIALDLQRSGLAVELRVDVGGADALERLAQHGCELLFLFGPASPQAQRVARELGCAWVTFPERAPGAAATLFREALFAALPALGLRSALAEAVLRARLDAAFAAAVQVSEQPFAARELRSGATRVQVADLMALANAQAGGLDDPDAAALLVRAQLLCARSAYALGEHDLALQLLSGSARGESAPAALATLLWHKAGLLGALGRSEHELAAYDELVSVFGQHPQLEVAERVASALYDKAITLAGLERPEDAIRAYGELVLRFGERAELSLAQLVARALVDQGLRLGALGRAEEELRAYEQVRQRFAGREELPLAEQLARAAFNQALTLAALGRSEDALGVYAEVAERFGERPEAPLALAAARSLFARAALSNQLDRAGVEGLFTEIVERFGARPEPEIAEVVRDAAGVVQLLRRVVPLGSAGA
jgi:tetratricopeptide (TPR) repeat protein